MGYAESRNYFSGGKTGMCVLFGIIGAVIGGFLARFVMVIIMGILQFVNDWNVDMCNLVVNIGTVVGAIIGGLIGFGIGYEKDQETAEKNRRLQVERNQIYQLKQQYRQTNDPRIQQAINSEINSAQCRMISIKSEYDHSDSSWDSPSSSSSSSSYEPIEFRYKDIYDESYNKVGYYDTQKNEAYTLGGVVTHRYDESTGEIQDGNYRKIGSYDSRTGTLYNNGNVRVGDYDENTGTIYGENYLRKGNIE